MSLVRWTLRRVAEELRDRVLPPWELLYWMPLAQAPDAPSCPGFELRPVKSLAELTALERARLQESIGASALDVFRDRLDRGHELHILFNNARVAGTVFFVLGKYHACQHVVLTDRDAMMLDARIDPDFRGRGLYRTFLALAMERLKTVGVERLFIDVSERNEPGIRPLQRLGFRFLLRFRAKRGRYRFDRGAS